MTRQRREPTEADHLMLRNIWNQIMGMMKLDNICEDFGLDKDLQNHIQLHLRTVQRIYRKRWFRMNGWAAYKQAYFNLASGTQWSNDDFWTLYDNPEIKTAVDAYFGFIL